MYIVLCFTTFIKRINHLHYMLQSIGAQTVKPNEIRCYTEVPQSFFPPHVKALLTALSVTIIPANEEWKGYKKLIGALQQSDRDPPETVYITVDDDWVYPPQLIQDLVETFLKLDKRSIVCKRGRKIVPGETYLKWPFYKSEPEHLHNTMIFSGSGMICSASMFPKDAINSSVFTKICPTADDLWWTMQAICNKTPVTSISPTGHIFREVVPIPNDAPLYNINRTQNDVQWNLLVQYAKEKKGVDICELVQQ